MFGVVSASGATWFNDCLTPREVRVIEYIGVEKFKWWNTEYTIERIQKLAHMIKDHCISDRQKFILMHNLLGI